MGVGAVTTPPLKFAACIDADDIALLQLPWTGNAVNDFVIHRDAANCREKALGPGTPLKSGTTFFFMEKLFHRPVNLTSRSSRTNETLRDLMGLPNNKTGISHGLNFSTRF